MTPGPCPRCEEAHPLIQCPYVKAVAFAEDGVTVIRAEFLTPADFPAPRGAVVEPDDYPKLRKI